MSFALPKTYKANRRLCAKYGIFDFIWGLYMNISLTDIHASGPPIFILYHNKLHGCLLNLPLKVTSNYQNALQHKLTANIVSSQLQTWVVQVFCTRFIIQYHYHSLSKECPWAGLLTSLPNQGVVTLACVSKLTTKERPCHVYSNSMPQMQSGSDGTQDSECTMSMV